MWHVICARYVTSETENMECFLGVVFDMENQKKKLRSAKSKGTKKKKLPKFGVKNFDRVFFLFPSLFTNRELFFLILHIKNYPKKPFDIIYFGRNIRFPYFSRVARSEKWLQVKTVLNIFKSVL